MIAAPGQYLDRLGRVARVERKALLREGHWFGVAGDGDPACWDANGICEGSNPSSIDLIKKVEPAA
jgi:hypothetical protein